MNSHRLSTKLSESNHNSIDLIQQEIEQIFNLSAPYYIKYGAKYLANTQILVSEPLVLYVIFQMVQFKNFILYLNAPLH